MKFCAAVTVELRLKITGVTNTLHLLQQCVWAKIKSVFLLEMEDLNQIPQLQTAVYNSVCFVLLVALVLMGMLNLEYYLLFYYQ